MNRQVSGPRNDQGEIVARVAAYVSYWHAYAVVRAHGETGITARPEPATIDGLVYAVTTRLNLVRAELAALIFQRSPQARELDERIEEFGSESITAELHGLTGNAG